MRNARLNQAANLLFTRFLPVTAGTCLLVSVNPCEARGGDDTARLARLQNRENRVQHSRREERQATNTALNPFTQGGFTAAFSAHVTRQTTGLGSRQFDLDLSSNLKNIQLGSKLFDGQENVTINVGGASETFTPGQQVTAAQFVAVQQVLAKGPQSISISASGTATGGVFSLNDSASSRVGDVVVPQNVSAVSYFNNNRSLNFAGDLTNNGSILGVSTDNKVRSGTISADDITNTGTITTDLHGTSLESMKGTVNHLDLTLLAENSLNNTGTISSSGNLTVATANGAITNAAPAVVSAAKQLNIFVGDGKLNNSGVINAVDGNLNIATSKLATDLNIDGAGGTFSADHGEINIRDNTNTDDNATNLNGGTYLSDKLNIHGGAGSINTYVDEISGQLNTDGLAAHVLTTDGTLTLGSNCLTGDPTFANTAGDIIINGAVTAGESITILAAGNIIATGTAYISTANSTGTIGTPATDVTLVAGATVTNPGGSNTTGIPIPGVGIGTGNQATVNFTGGLGGNIDFTGSKYLGYLIDTSSTLQGGGNQQDNGGDVILAAFSTSVDNGRILFPDGRLAIRTSSLYNNSGDVSLIAGNASTSTKTAAIRTGIINTQADLSLGNNDGDVRVFAAQPETSDGNVTPITYDSTGARVGVTGYEFDPANLNLTGGTIVLNGAILAGDANADIITAQSGVGGIFQSGEGRVQAGRVTLTAGTGGIGGGLASKKATRVLTETDTLNLNSGSSAFVNNLGDVTLGTATLPGGTGGDGGTFDVSTTADGEGDGQITVRNGDSIAATSGLLAFINLTSSGDIAGTSGIRTPGGATLVANTVNLADVNPADGVVGLGFGTIGQNAANPINVDANFVGANTQGSVFVLSDGAVTILDSSAGNLDTFDVRTTADIGGNGSITIAGTIASAFGRIGTIFLASTETGAGTGGIVTNAPLVAETVRLRDDNNASGNGDGNASIGTADAPILVQASILNVDTTGPEINIVNTIATGMDLNAVGTNVLRPGTFTLTSSSTIHTTGTVFVNTAANLIVGGKSTSSGNIILGGDIDVSGGTATLTASGNITREDNNNDIIATNTILTSTAGSIGTDLIPLTMLTTNLTANAVGNVYIANEDVGTLNLVSTTAKGQFSLVSDGAINVNTDILTAAGIKIETTGSTVTDDITINGLLGSTKTTSYVEITSDGLGDIIFPNINNVIGAKVRIDLSTGGGFIGTQAAPVIVQTPGLSANTDGAPGEVNLVALASKKVPTTLFNSGSEGDFFLASTGSINLTNLVTVNGNIGVLAAGKTGNITTQQNSIIQIAEPANRTNQPVSILLASTSTKGVITLAPGTTVATYLTGVKTGAGQGDITIQTAPLNGAPAGTNPGNVTITTMGTGAVLFGDTTITALAPNNILNALDADIIFQAGQRPGSIVLGGGVTITADPPVTATTTAPTTQSVSLSAQNHLATTLAAMIPSMQTNESTASSSEATPSAMAVSSKPVAGQTMPNIGTSLNGFANLDSSLATIETALSLAAPAKQGWLSDTELSSGEIPAAIVSDRQTGVTGDSSCATIATLVTVPTSVKLSSGRTLSGSVQNHGTQPSTSLYRGSALFAPKVDTVIETAVGNIRIGANSLALVMAFANGLAVYDLDDVRKGSVEVTAAGHSIKLSPGQHLYITGDNVRSFADINPAQLIGYRGITSRKLNNGHTAFSAEFSVPHAIHAVKPLKELVRSNHPEAQKISRHLLKTTAAIMQLRGNSEYQQMFRAAKTAYAR